METPVVSHLVTVFDKAAVVAETLAAIRGQVSPGPFEIVCVDDASRDDSLAVLRAEAARDPRISVIAAPANEGPARAVNRAAAAARGRYLHPVDGDDIPAPNAAAFMIEAMERLGAPLMFGRNRRGLAAAGAPAAGDCRIVAKPLAFAARRQLSRMGFMVERALWDRAGGADPGVFIQDQSLPLRLAAAAPRMIWTDAIVYRLRPRDGGSLSRAVIQQHHDRFLSALRVWGANPAHPATPELMRMMVSALWKLRRDRGALPWASRAFAAYALHRLAGIAPSAGALSAAEARLARLSGVRRPGPPP